MQQQLTNRKDYRAQREGQRAIENYSKAAGLRPNQEMENMHLARLQNCCRPVTPVHLPFPLLVTSGYSVPLPPTYVE